MNKIAFINAIKGQAIRDMKSYGVLASITIAQAILESGWGGSALTTQANNLFGIKVSDSWQGEKIYIPTTEYYNGVPKKENAWFRKYASWIDSIKDHTELLRKPLYYPVRKAKNYKDGCYALTLCGYATDTNYWKELIEIIEQNKLYEFDEQINFMEVFENMTILDLQRWLNAMKITDYEGKALVEDGLMGRRTESAKKKYKELLALVTA